MKEAENYRQNDDGTWSIAKPLTSPWDVRLRLWWKRLIESKSI